MKRLSWRSFFRWNLFLIAVTSLLMNPYVFSIGAKNIIPVRILIIIWILAVGVWLVKHGVIESFRQTFELLRFRPTLRAIIYSALVLAVIRLATYFEVINVPRWFVMNAYWLTVVGFGVTLLILLANRAIAKDDLLLGLWGWYVGGVGALITAVYQVFMYVVMRASVLGIWGMSYPNVFRTTGLSNDPNHMSLIAVITGCFALFFLYESVHRRLWHALVLVFAVAVFFTTGSRTGVLAAVAAAAVVVVLSLITKLINWRVIGYAVVSIAVGFSLYQGLIYVVEDVCQPEFRRCPWNLTERRADGSAIIPLTPILTPIPVEHETTADRSLSLTTQTSSIQAHLTLIRIGWKLGLKHPFLGVGYGNFSYGVRQDPDLLAELAQFDAGVAESDSFPSHTLWAEVVAETGFVGLFIYASLVLALLIVFIRTALNPHNGALDRRLAISLAAICVAGQVVSIFFALNEEFYWVLMWCGAFALRLRAWS